MKKQKLNYLILLAIFTGFTACSEPKQEEPLITDNLKHVAILLGEGFHDGEAYMPLGYLTNRGIIVTVIGPQVGEVKAYNSDFTIKIEKSVTDISVSDFDALIIPGGQAPGMLREITEVVEFARNFFESGKPTAAICHGPQVLIRAGVMEGKNTTAYSGVKDELLEAGANYFDQGLVNDGNLITSRVPGDLNQFSKAIYEAL